MADKNFNETSLEELNTPNLSINCAEQSVHNNSNNLSIAISPPIRNNDYFYYYAWCADGTEKIRRMSIQGRKVSSFSSDSSINVEPHAGGEIESVIEIPETSTKPNEEIEKIDESHTPKKLTLITERMIRKFSGTHLSKLQEDIVPFARKAESSSNGRHISSKIQLDNICENNTNLPCAKNDSKLEKMKSYLKESRVLVLYTGGTIGMRWKPNKHGASIGVYSPEQHYLPRAIREQPTLNDQEYVDLNYANLQVKPFALPPVRGMKKRVVYWIVEYEPLLDSSDMTFDDWIRIAKDIEKSYSAYDGFVVLHGTDTLAYTACALSFMMENLGKPVVITGSQIPVAEVRSDGRENMVGALIVAGNLDIPEVTILFQNKLLRGNRATKLDSSALLAFDSPNMAPLATMDISINVNFESIFRSSEVAPFRIHDNLCRNVVVLRIFPSMPIESVQASLKYPTQGVVLQTFGSGNMPSRRVDILEELENAVKRGCLIVNVSQCVKGHVDVHYANGKIVADAGVIPGSDMTTEAALTKLAYVLSKHEWDNTRKTIMLQRNIRGELTVTRTERLNEFDIIQRLAKFLRITSAHEIKLLRNALFPSLVCHAAHSNDLNMLEILQSNGANLATVDYNQRTALHVAAAAGSLDAVEFLLKHGVSVHARDSSDESALFCGVKSRNLDVIKAIRRAGGQLAISNAFARQRIGIELCMASGEADMHSLQCWQEAGVDFNLMDYQCQTPLHIAVNVGSIELVEFLLKYNANPHQTDNLDLSSLDHARLKRDSSKTIEDDVNKERQERLDKFTKIVEILEHYRPKFD